MHFLTARANNYKIWFFRILCQFICSQPLIDFLVDNKSILSSTYADSLNVLLYVGKATYDKSANCTETWANQDVSYCGSSSAKRDISEMINYQMSN